MDEAAPYSPPQSRPLRLFRRHRGRDSHPHQAKGSRTRLVGSGTSFALGATQFADRSRGIGVEPANARERTSSTNPVIERSSSNASCAAPGDHRRQACRSRASDRPTALNSRISLNAATEESVARFGATPQRAATCRRTRRRRAEVESRSDSAATSHRSISA